jgi:hypothetical protein
MNYWFIVHDLKAYEQHKDLIGCRIKKSGMHEPKFRQFSEIKKGDKIVYYATKSNVIVGIFVVDSEMRYLANDPHWNSMVFNIRPAEMPPDGYYVDFKRAFQEDKQELDLFPKKKVWYGYLQGKTCRKLSEHDFQIIRGYLGRHEYLVRKEDVKVPETKWHEVPKKRVGRKPESGLASSHDSIVDSLATIGEIFGYEPARKPSVNDLRPADQPFKAKGKTLDLAWEIFGLTHIPFEVQVHGSVPDLIYRLNLVHQWSLKIVIVADQEWHDEIKEAAQVYPFAGKLVMITPREIEKAKKDYAELKSLRQKIFA